MLSYPALVLAVIFATGNDFILDAVVGALVVGATPLVPVHSFEAVLVESQIAGLSRRVRQDSSFEEITPPDSKE